VKPFDISRHVAGCSLGSKLRHSQRWNGMFLSYNDQIHYFIVFSRLDARLVQA